MNRRQEVDQTTSSVVSAPRLFVGLPKKLLQRRASDGMVRKAPSARLLGASVRTLGIVAEDNTNPASNNNNNDAEIQLEDEKKSGPSLFVNPPSFAIDNVGKTHQRRHTIGVPMIRHADYRSSSKKTGDKKPKKSLFVRASSTSSQSSSPSVFVNPPACSATPTGRVRKTLGVPMV